MCLTDGKLLEEDAIFMHFHTPSIHIELYGERGRRSIPIKAAHMLVNSLQALGSIIIASPAAAVAENCHVFPLVLIML